MFSPTLQNDQHSIFITTEKFLKRSFRNLIGISTEELSAFKCYFCAFQQKCYALFQKDLINLSSYAFIHMYTNFFANNLFWQILKRRKNIKLSGISQNYYWMCVREIFCHDINNKQPTNLTDHHPKSQRLIALK